MPEKRKPEPRKPTPKQDPIDPNLPDLRALNEMQNSWYGGALAPDLLDIILEQKKDVRRRNLVPDMSKESVRIKK